MNIFAKFRNKMRAITQLRGTAAMKRALWNKEFETGYWDHIANTTGDFVHDVINRYIGSGSLIDLGCGVGSIGLQLPEGSYRAYIGVDISDVALEQARASAARAGRANTNRYVREDIETFLPSEPPDIILLSESLYYVPKVRVARLLQRLATRLAPTGVIIVRLHDREGYADHVRIIATTLRVLEEIRDEGSDAVVFVCRQARSASRAFRLTPEPRL